MADKPRLCPPALSFGQSDAIARDYTSCDVSMRHGLMRIRARPPHHPCVTSSAARSDRAVPRPDHLQVR